METKSQELSEERLSGIVERVTYHNPENGWSVLKVTPFRDPARMVTVLIHQVQVFAGATMEFHGAWTVHPKHGDQFKAARVVEKKPASSAALEKYLGSGLIKGVGPVTARKIVGHFKDRTLEVFEDKIEELLAVPGIAHRKLGAIKDSWQEHRAIRDVMIFLQKFGISTLFAVKIYKSYGDRAIDIVSDNPYRLAHDIYGIGFFSADRIALRMGFDREGPKRTEAGIKHVLAASREEGHCYLTEAQIIENTTELLEGCQKKLILELLRDLLASDQIKMRTLQTPDGTSQACYYSRSLYFDEESIAHWLRRRILKVSPLDKKRARDWIEKYCDKNSLQLSDEQQSSVAGIPQHFVSILTGGPGCGKTTTTRVLVEMLKAMKKRVFLAAPTGRAAQRMSEVIGQEARTIHRLLEWVPTQAGFKKNEKDPLQCDFLIIDECSMLDVSLSASLFKATPENCQVLLIGDPDQLPAVGAGNVLNDLLDTPQVPRFRLTQIFRQAEKSQIVQFAHSINRGEMPKMTSLLADPTGSQTTDCLFVDSDEVTRDQARFIQRAKLSMGRSHFGSKDAKNTLSASQQAMAETEDWTIPEKYRHVDLSRLMQTQTTAEELLEVIKWVPRWSTLHYGLTASDTILHLITKTIPERLGSRCEIQVLVPQVRGSLGTMSLNKLIQGKVNPWQHEKSQLVVGERTFRDGDRVIQTRNNYDLGVFNGDIGTIKKVDLEDQSCLVGFGSDHREVQYRRENLSEINLAYAITVHKSQGSEFEAVILPVVNQHFNMLFRNLVYTGLTRAKKLAIFVGSRQTLAMAIGRIDNRERQTGLKELI